ncbi:MAG: hypothetical protein A3D96_02190 [Chlamydiae bacterium RIFCSPHIGHO2_12_FULL_44_59]|nr:MAG: hypothetical protein A2796_04880 [Chlamydiae bacterium RIFCSPHIGHO2_01_FULL_44_39]OGN57082.1 MAG: hypothetical protein A3C42_06955 [Chlamydiae bacterium RIFCSPHIGHO2_02_FULL_45_9]OGN60716.1 MAG: hypothetical protein A3D96_02190 [Chlamydiae bacterium RIFCSPHIGHO2_12_FULL_44_59]OGN66976.1 MAG: hypothetical protein A2978_02420 [Chlamydiae bacterium RIFCSPLOWO2_01_FULL_44_52]OGN67527.1 MAG: hypothetical protein A3I67_03635 [Chlamydiae bacterium RIFCSPLOWO2_02_FULL_45_22]OGN71230.1 MAG: hyp
MRGMKKLLFVLALCFLAGFFALRYREFKREETIALPLAFLPSSFTLVNRPFAIVIVGVNNGATLEKTLASIFSQNYENFRLIYVDDASDDGSAEFAKDLINQSDRTIPVTFVQNEERLGNLANIFRSVTVSEDEEIIVVLRGEDWLAHEWVLQRLNAYFADPDLWVVCGGAMDFPTFQKSTDFSYRENLNVFYAKLFKHVRKEDFLDAGQFLPVCTEFAYMIPMLEMAQGHFHRIDEVLLIRSSFAVVQEDREMATRIERQIRGRQAYAPLTSLQVFECGNDSLQ